MQLNFQKIPYTSSSFTATYNDINLEGNFIKIDRNLAKIDAKLKGILDLECYRCANEFQSDIDEEFSCIISDGIYKAEDNSLEDIIIEIDENMINFDDIIISEIESIKSDYNSCGKCNNIEEFKF